MTKRSVAFYLKQCEKVEVIEFISLPIVVIVLLNVST